MEVFMGICDFIPVLLFLQAAISLQRSLYSKLSKGAFALFAGGTIMVVAAGTYKALWKVLYYAGICDWVNLNKAFFPMQALGFLLAGIALVAMLTHCQGNTAYGFVAPAAFSGTMIFVTMMILGLMGMNFSLAYLGAKLKKKGIVVLYALSFILMLMMGYLSSKDFSSVALNWVAQGINILGLALFLIAARKLRKAGIENLEIVH
ncbi:MAG: hypothetical protein KBS81_02485 [Spirochaetales bacterium]|nr:hypothetical protein [Candidatus Physcosoma equi]